MRRRLVGPAEGRTIAANRHLAAVPYPPVAALALRTVTQRSRVLVSAAVQYAVRPMTGMQDAAKLRASRRPGSVAERSGR